VSWTGTVMVGTRATVAAVRATGAAATARGRRRQEGGGGDGEYDDGSSEGGV